jgi:hypothetical protein
VSARAQTLAHASRSDHPATSPPQPDPTYTDSVYGRHRPFHTHLAQWEEDEFDGRARKPFARVNSPVRLLAQSPGERSHTSSWDEMASTGGGGGGQISMEQQISTIEQGLVMSRRVPLGKVCRLGTTRYSRLRKDTLASPVRRFRRETPIPSLDQEVQFAE